MNQAADIRSSVKHKRLILSLDGECGIDGGAIRADYRARS